MSDENTQLSFDVIMELKNAVQIIDYAADQGAFKGWGSINQVLGCRGRLVAFIELMQGALQPDGATNETTSNEEMVQVDEVPAHVVDEPSTTAHVVEAAPVQEEPVVDNRIDEQLSAIQQRREQMLAELAALDQQAADVSGNNA